MHDVEAENIRLKTENAAVMATLMQERERIRALESKNTRYESSLDALNRKLRDKDEYIAQMERHIGDKQHQLERKDQEKEKQRRKFDMKLAAENEKLEIKLGEEKRKMQQAMRMKEEKLRLVTDIVNGTDEGSEPVAVSNLIHRFNSNCENVIPPGSERKTRPRVSDFY